MPEPPRPRSNAVVIIEASGRWQLPRFDELWAYRTLYILFVRRDVVAKYRQTVLGPLHAVLVPLVTMVIFTLFFGGLAKLPNDGIPYPLFYYSALVPWSYFAGVFGSTASSLTANAYLIQKVYFPRLLLPLVPALSRSVGFLVSLVLLGGMMVFYDVQPTTQLLWLPVLTGLLILGATGAGMWMTALDITYRDVGFAIPFVIQMWMVASPVIYPLSVIPERFRGWCALNPMYAIIGGFRSVLTGRGSVDVEQVGIAAVVTLVLFVSGLFYFSAAERHFADVA